MALFKSWRSKESLTTTHQVDDKIIEYSSKDNMVAFLVSMLPHAVFYCLQCCNFIGFGWGR